MKNKNMKKRVLSVFLVTALLGTSLSGCGDNAGNNASNQPSNNVDADGYAYYGFHEVAETPLVDISFEDAENVEASLKNNGSAEGDVILSSNAGAELVNGRFELGNSLNLTAKDTYISTPDLGELDALTFFLWMNIKDLQTRENTDEERVTTLLDTKAGEGRVTLKLVHTGVPPKMDPETKEVDQGDNSTKLVFTVEGNTGGSYADDSVAAKNDRFYQYEYTFSEKAQNWISHLPGHCWFNLGIVYNPEAKTVTIYESGKLDSTHTFETAVKPVLDEVRIGAGNTDDQYLEGIVDDIKIYDKALTAEDIEALADFERDMWVYRTAADWKESSTVLYVDGENGDDNNPGTKEEPFATVKKGIESIEKEGTRLVIAPGTYREASINLNASGTELEPIIIEAAEGGEVIINGSSVLENWEPTSKENVYVHEWPEEFPEGNSSTGNDFAYRTDMLYVDGEPTKPVFTKEELTVNTYYLDEEGQKVYYMTNKMLGKFTVEVPDVGVNFVDDMMANLFRSNSNNYFVMRGITFTNCGTQIFGSAVNFCLSKHVLIEDCKFNNTTGRSLEFENGVQATTAEDIIVRRCTFDNNGSGALSPGFRTMNLLIENCEFTDSDWKITWSAYDAPDPACLKFMVTKNIIVRNCKFDGNRTHDLWFDNTNWNVDIVGNSFTNNSSNNAIYPEINPSSVQIRNNSIEGGLHFSNNEGTIIDNNIIWSKDNPLFTEWGVEVRYDANNKDRINQGGPGLTWARTILTNNTFYLGRENTKMFEFTQYESFYDMYADGNKFYIEGGSPEDCAYRGLYGQEVNFEDLKVMIGDESAEFYAENPFLDDGKATVSFKDEASVSLAETLPNYIPVVLSKPLIKEVSVSYTIKDADTDEVIGSGVLEFSSFDTQKVIYVGEDNRNVVVTLSDAKDIKLGEFTTHNQVKAE